MVPARVFHLASVVLTLGGQHPHSKSLDLFSRSGEAYRGLVIVFQSPLVIPPRVRDDKGCVIGFRCRTP